MNYLLLIVFALIPLILLESCSTPPPVRQGSVPRQAQDISGVAPLPSSEPFPQFPHYGRVPDYGDDADVMFGTFPRPRTLENQVKFWRDVYSTWSRSQVAIHDDLHLNVVYEVLQLPGYVGEGMTSMQKDYVRERMDYWRDRLNGLEAKHAVRLPLDGEERRLAMLLTMNEDGAAAIRGAGERLRNQRGMRERFRRGLEISGMYERRFREIFRKAGLPEDLVYLPHVESSYQFNARSSAGALGIWQFTAGAARMFMNGDDSARNRLDPLASAYGAARYLSYAYGKLGSWPLAVTSYNHGIGGMQRAKNLYGHDFSRIVKDYNHPLFGFASRNYYAEFLAAREIASQPDRFFPEGVMYAKEADWSLSRLAAAADEQAERPRPVAMAEARRPVRLAKVVQLAPVKHSGALNGRKVAVREVSKSGINARTANKTSKMTGSKPVVLHAGQKTRTNPVVVKVRRTDAAAPPAAKARQASARSSSTAAVRPISGVIKPGSQKIARR